MVGNHTVDVGAGAGVTTWFCAGGSSAAAAADSVSSGGASCAVAEDQDENISSRNAVDIGKSATGTAGAAGATSGAAAEAATAATPHRTRFITGQFLSTGLVTPN